MKVYAHFIGERKQLSPVLGGTTKWQMTFCGVVAATTSKLVDDPDKVTCPDCKKRIASWLRESGR